MPRTRSTQRSANKDSQSADPRLARFVITYEQSHNIAAAMRAAGLSSRSTAYRWLRWYREDDHTTPHPRTRARTTGRISTAIRGEIIDLRHQYPSWGRRRLAHELTRRHGQPIASPASIQRILTKARLWPEPQSPLLTGWTDLARLDTDQLLADCQRGIQLDVHNQVRAAADVLEHEVWNRIGPDLERQTALLREPVLGSWLLRSLIHLGHALIVTGRWFPALGYLEAAKHWLLTLPADRQQIAFAESTQWLSDGVGTPWAPFQFGVFDPFGRPPISLRRDDVWVECCQYLGVVLRDDPAWRGLEALQEGLRVFGPQSRRQLDPRCPANTRGTLEHDLGRLMLRTGTFPADQIERRLAEADFQMRKAQFQGALGHGMLAATAITRAQLYHRQAGKREPGNSGWTRAMELMTAEVVSAIDHAERDPTPVIGVTVVIDATKLLLGADMINELDHARLDQAAQVCATDGYAGQARELLAVPGVHQHLPDETLAQLSKLVADTRRL